MTYSPGQARALFRHWPGDVRWFLLGGPADGDEAQTVRAEYPSVRCVGFEPNAAGRRLQETEMAFPGPVLPYALWSRNRTMRMDVPSPGDRSATVCRDLTGHPVGESYDVEARTLDWLSETHGPFERAVLWLDVEGAELEALRGADGLLEGRRILLVNVEVMSCARGTLGAAIDGLLRCHGFRRVGRWGRRSGNHEDLIYRLEGE